MTTTTISTRSNAVLTKYVKACDRMRALTHELKELERLEEQLRAEVLQQLSEDPRPVKIGGALRIVRKDVERSVSIIDQAKALEYARQHGLKIQEPKPETVNTNTLRARALDGVLPEGICKVTETPVIVIT